MLGPQQAAAAGLRPEPTGAADGPARRDQEQRNRREHRIRARLHGISIGRGGPNDVRLDGDDYASANHARVEPRRDGVWIEDVGSTNGTFVNGVRLSRRASLPRATSSAWATRT